MKNALTGISKIFLLICLGAAFAVDLTAFVVLLVQGAEVKYWIFPMLFMIADAAFIVQASLSNFRFSYTVGEIVCYMVLSAGMIICTLAVCIFGGLTVFSTEAGAFWIALHVVVLAAVLACFLYASKRVRGKRVTQTVITAVFTAVCLICAAFYATFLFGMGFFGQGPMQSRTLAYEYNEDGDCYEVKSVLNGRGTYIYVPDEFNGKKVEKVSSEIFTAKGVNQVTLACSPDVEFTGMQSFSGCNAGLSVNVLKEDVLKYRDVFYNMYKSGVNGGLELANKTVPFNLEKDEVFISFSYTQQSYEEAGRVALPVWMGKKGDTFKLSDFKQIKYATHTNSLSDEDLHYSFVTNNGYIISPLTQNGKNIDGAAVTESLEDVEINFQKIYRIYAGEGNDAKHPVTEDFKPSVVAGNPSFTAKYTTVQNADKILEDFLRDGFDLTLEYTKPYSAARTQFTSLKSVLAGITSTSDITVYPVWRLKDPILEIRSDRAGNTLVYGEDIKLTADTKAPAAGVKLDYEWTADNQAAGTDDYLNIVNIPYKSDTDGLYYASLVVKASADFTSLTSQTSGQVNITVTRRPINVRWTVPAGADAVYNASAKTVYCAIDTAGIINGDSVSLAQTDFVNTAAGTYPYIARLSGADDGYKYYIDQSTQSQSFTIKKAPLTAVWSDTEKYFNGKTQYPTVNFTDVCGSDTVAHTVSGAMHAGTHTVTCTLNVYGAAANYELTNPQFNDFLIKQLPVDIRRSGAESKFTYDGKWHEVIFTAVATSEYKDIYNYDIPATPSVSRIKDAGNYDITATVGNDFFIASGSPMYYTIDKCSSQQVIVESSRLTYNGNEQAPRCYIYGVGMEAGQKIYVDGTGKYKDVGDYTFTADSPENTNYYVYYPISYKIQPCTVELVYNERKVTYNGQEQRPDVHAYGVGDDGELNLQLTCADFVSANNHRVEIAVEDGANYLARNYELSQTYCMFTIDRVSLTARADNITVTEGDALPALTYTVTGFVNGEHFDYPLECEIEGYSGGNLSAGTYTIRVYYKDSPSSPSYPKGNYVVYFVTGTLTVRAREGA